MESQINVLNASDVAQRTSGEIRLAKAAETAIEKVMSASPQKRAAKIVEWAAAYQCASDEARITVANHIVAFGRDAFEFIERCDFGGLNSLISAFASNVRTYAEIPPAAPPLMMPEIGGDVFRSFGWSMKEQDSLQTVLLTPSLGVKRGDRVVEIDEHGVRLASGLKFTRAQLFAAGNHSKEGDSGGGHVPTAPGRTGIREVRR